MDASGDSGALKINSARGVAAALFQSFDALVLNYSDYP